MNADESLVARLFEVIESRARERPVGSYTVELLDAGHATLAAKLLEEAYETVAAAAEEDGPAVVHEAADVVYHLLVLLVSAGVSWRDVERELTARFGVSGLAAKAARETPQS